MTIFTHCREDGSGCVTFYQEPPARIAKMQPVRKFDPADLAEIRDTLISIKKALPEYLRKQRAAAIMNDPARLDKMSFAEIEESFPR